MLIPSFRSVLNTRVSIPSSTMAPSLTRIRPSLKTLIKLLDSLLPFFLLPPSPLLHARTWPDASSRLQPRLGAKKKGKGEEQGGGEGGFFVRASLPPSPQKSVERERELENELTTAAASLSALPAPVPDKYLSRKISLHTIQCNSRRKKDMPVGKY